MGEIITKTEIETLDGTPDKRMFWSIISDYDLTTGITELIDNAIDLWMSTPDRAPLNVDIILDTQRQLITLVDNAGGVMREDLRLLIAPGGSKNNPYAKIIGVFGVGSKRAVVALAEYVTIKTHHAEDKSYQVDIGKEWLESPVWELAAYVIPEVPPGTTRIELSHLRLPIEVQHEVALLDHIGEVYEYYLHHKDCNISVNGTNAQSKRFDNWAYPPSHNPRRAFFTTWPDGTGCLEVEIMAGLVTDRDPVTDNYGVYIYCNNRLIVKNLKSRDVGYFNSSEAGVPHPDASLCRAIVRLTGPARLMPWNSSKTGINFTHPAFVHLRPTLIQLISHFSSLSRRLKDDWPAKVFEYTTGSVEEVDEKAAVQGATLHLPPLPRVRRSRPEKLRALNKMILQDNPWTLGLVEAMAAVDIMARQKLATKNRISLILLDSNFEIALKEYIVHRIDLFPPGQYPDKRIQQIFQRRPEVISTVTSKVSIDGKLLGRVRHYYQLRNKLIHERATVEVGDEDIANYRDAIEKILEILFGFAL